MPTNLIKESRIYSIY